MVKKENHNVLQTKLPPRIENSNKPNNNSNKPVNNQNQNKQLQKPQQNQNKQVQMPQQNQNKQVQKIQQPQKSPPQKLQQNNNKQVQKQPPQNNNNPLKFVYFFGENTDKFLVGGKGANMSDMVNIGLPVPAGFTITTEACRHFYVNNEKYPTGLIEQMDANILRLEKEMNMKFGSEQNPLLVSVRSGAAVSMPGMMDTILNLGLNDNTIKGMIKSTGNERFALDCYRRFIQMFGDVVMNVEHRLFEEAIEKKKNTRGVKLDTQLTIEDMRELIQEYKDIVKKSTGKMFPSDVKEQLKLSINAVFSSWNSDRAIKYRQINEIKSLAGTAVNIQAMVFGNMGEDSGTGVAFTRNPSTGENKFYGEYLINAQGEDVVAGIRTPEPVAKLEKQMPAVYKQLIGIRDKLEKFYKDMQDIEFTVQKGKLYMLQTRSGKRTGLAAVRTAVEMFKEGLITKDQALMRVDANQINQLLHKRIDPIAKSKAEVIARGLPASPGAAVGKIVFNAEDAATQAEQSDDHLILVRLETSPEDIEGMHVSQGILTARGGMTSHAAVVARGMGKCCVSGVSELVIDEKKKTLKVQNKIFKEGDYLTLDGTTGEVYAGKLPVIDPILAGEFAELMKWADETKKLGVRANADTPQDAEIAKGFGAEGIGLCRTEHMFFEGERITSMREMILADDETQRRKALNKLLPYQRADFEGIFKVMNNLPVIIRFLDPPLHEFLPKEQNEIKALAKILNMDEEKVKSKIESLHEFNPMLGFRGCRLGVVYPEISEMQARAVFEAALNSKKNGITAMPEIEIPNIIAINEFKFLKNIVEKVAVETGAKGKINYKIGTMIEFPRAVLIADELAKEAEFMSFGTNDLTQTTLGFSRDDAGRFIPSYVSNNIFEKDPFQTLDQEGVGKIMKMAITKARSVKRDMDMGICGEHGGDPATVKFCHKIGLSNVSCSPYRVPIAILAAAQAVVEQRMANAKNMPQKTQQVKPQAQQNKQVQQNNKPNNQNQKPQQNQNKQVQQKPQQNNQKQPQNNKQNQNKVPQQNNNNKHNPNQQRKPLPKAKTIREEIRDIVLEELRNMNKK
ncbi:MAG: pyruvate, phosphate dikinase [archaeon]